MATTLVQAAFAGSEDYVDVSFAAQYVGGVAYYGIGYVLTTETAGVHLTFTLKTTSSVRINTNKHFSGTVDLTLYPLKPAPA